MAVSFLENATTALSKYALVYAGLTGDAFMPSARRAKALTTGVGKFGRRGFSAERGYSITMMLWFQFNLWMTNAFLFVWNYSASDPTNSRSAHADIPIRADNVLVRRTYIDCPRSGFGCCSARWGGHSTCWVVLCGVGQRHVSYGFKPSELGGSQRLTNGILIHSADTFYICYCIDKNLGERRREEVFLAVRRFIRLLVQYRF